MWQTLHRYRGGTLNFRFGFGIGAAAVANGSTMLSGDASLTAMTSLVAAFCVADVDVDANRY